MQNVVAPVFSNSTGAEIADGRVAPRRIANAFSRGTARSRLAHNRNDKGALGSASPPDRITHIGDEDTFNTRYNASNSWTSLGEMNRKPLRFVSANQAVYPIATMCRSGTEA